MTAASGCGSLPNVPANSPDGSVKALAKSYLANYDGFVDYPVVKSPWAHWKPKHKSGWNIQIVWDSPINEFQTVTLAGLKQRLSANPKVGTVQVQVPASPSAVPQQLQELGTAIQRKPDLIILQPIAGAAAAPVVAQAAKAGIPVVSAWNSTPSKYAVSVATNTYLNAGVPAAGILKLMGGTGSVLEVHGIPAVQVDQDEFVAFKKALSLCPNVKVAGAVTGGFQNSVAKSVVQQFLATHPSGVQGVLQAGTMDEGILGAFAQTGHATPPMADPGTSEGVVSYWHSHPTFKAVGTTAPDNQIGSAIGDVALRMLEGQGVKIDALIEKPFVISASDLSQVWKPSYTAGSTDDTFGPSGTFMSDAYLNGLFNHPATP